MISLRNVSKYYYKNGMISSGISKVSLDFRLGEFVVITGESGSGKSTLLNVISGLDSYEEGEMYINGEETSHYLATDFEKYRKKYIANIFQTFNLVSSYTVYQNVELILLINGYRDVHERVNNILRQVGMLEYAKTKVSKLSGGQKQRVAIARALAKDTDIIVADEPTANLDSESAGAIGRILREIAKDKLVIVVTHSFDQFAPYATRRVKMHDGRIVEDVLFYNTPMLEPGDYRQGNLSFGNQIRLGIRNTFNIPYKFLLLFMVFLFLAASTMGLYSAYIRMDQAAEEQDKMNEVFANASDKRIILTKDHGVEFTDQDYERLRATPGIGTVVPNDIILDKQCYLTLETDELYCFPHGVSELEGVKLHSGRLPEKEDEVVVGIGDLSYYSDLVDQNGQFRLSDMTTSGKKVTVVGVVKKQRHKYDMEDIYLNDDYLQTIRAQEYASRSSVSLESNGIIWNNDLGEDEYGLESMSFMEPSKKVPKGKMVVPEGFGENFQIPTTEYTGESEEMPMDRSFVGKGVDVTVENPFFTEKTAFQVSDVYNDKKSFEKTVGGKYDEGLTAVYINQDDYNGLFRKGNYQCSVYVESTDKIEEVLKGLKGYKTFVMAETMSSESEIYGGGMEGILSLLLPIIIAVIFVIFCISYIVIGLILRSRNAYFSILRILGLQKRRIENILNIEILLIANLAFAVVTACKAFTRVFPATVQKMLDIMGVKDYIILYILIMIMALLISHLFARKLFKKTAIGTFREGEV